MSGTLHMDFVCARKGQVFLRRYSEFVDSQGECMSQYGGGKSMIPYIPHRINPYIIPSSISFHFFDSPFSGN